MERTLPDLVTDLDLSPVARDQLRESFSTLEYVEHLMRYRLYADATRVLARALPKRRAVHWVCASIRADAVENPGPRALEAAEHWVDEPEESRRIAALEIAEASDYDTPSAWAAAAAGWSAGSMVDADLPPVAPPDHLTAQAVAAALGLLATLDPTLTKSRQRSLLAKGLELLEEARRAS